MGNKPRGGACEKLIESLQNSNLQTVGGGHDMFQTGHHGSGAPSLPSPHPPMDSFSRAPESFNLLELLMHAPQGVNPGNQSDLLASLGDNVMGKSSSRELHQHLETPKKSWTGPTKLPSPSLWMLQRHLEKSNLPLPGLAGSGTKSPKTGFVPSSVSEERARQTRPQPIGCGISGKQTKLLERAMTTNPLSMKVKPDKSLATEAFALGAESPSPRRASKDMIDMDAKMMDLSPDCSDQNMDELEEKNVCNGQIGMDREPGWSKNRDSERERRKKFNDGLYKLRALVPNITKMDRVSIIGDAIDYVCELQKQVEDLQAGISDMEASAVGEEVLSSVAEPSDVEICEGRCWEEDGSKNLDDRGTEESMAELMAESVEQKIVELDVSLMEDQIYHLQIFCTKGPGVFVQLMQSLEALGLEVLNANLTSLQDNILNTFIAEIKGWETMKTQDVKKAIMDVASRFGLQ